MADSYLSRYVPDSRFPGRWARFLTVLTAALVLGALAAAPNAAAISDDEELTQFGGPVGIGAGQMLFPTGIAADPVTGHVFVADQEANRISEFTPWGNFVKAFGWAVAPGAVNEQQEVRVRAATGQFSLSFDGSTTGDLAFDAPGSASEGPGSVEAALNALPTIGGVAGGEVSVSAVPGAADGKTPFIYVVAFKGSLAGTNVDPLTASDGTTPLSGGVPSTGLEVRTRADGTAGGAGLESCTAESTCQAGIEGSGAGQLGRAGGLAVDADGNVYVKETWQGAPVTASPRVQKFDSAGRFQLMFGGEVNKTTNEDVCTKAQLEGGDVCGAATMGTAPGQFEEALTRGIALGAGGQIFAADKERIQRFNLQGEFEASIPVPGHSITSLAFDPAGGNLYVTLYGQAGVHKLDPATGTQIDELEGQSFVAVDSPGNVYASGPSGDNQLKIVQYDASGQPLSPPSCCDSGAGRNFDLGTNTAGNLYISTLFDLGSANSRAFIRIFGPPPVTFEGPPPLPPSISAQFASSVGRDDATLGAEINPHFWTNARYYVEYGTGKCSEGGCEETKPVPPGATLTSKVTDGAVKTAGVFLEGLQPGTTYHYRFVAESSGGGPVRGVGGEVGADGEEGSFTTYPNPSPPKADCPNQVFRTGFSAPLPDCRAYEMVSPIDKNNGDIATLPEPLAFSTALDQSSGEGERFTYSSYRAFADPEAAPYTIQYMAARTEGVGWSSEALNPTQGPAGGVNEFTSDNPYKAFSSDLCSAWLAVVAEPALAPGAPEDRRNLYRQDGCGSKGYEALVQTELPPLTFFPVLQGVSSGGREAIFGADSELTDDAAPAGTFQAYYASAGELRLLCVLPSGLPSSNHCSAGTGAPSPYDTSGTRARWGSYTNAISGDGSRVYWTDSGNEGKIYLRLNPGEEQSEVSGGQCTEPEKACTLEVSETASTKESRFLGASPDGSRAIFEVADGAQKGSLFLFDSGEESSRPIAANGLGIAGMSDDLSRIYFASEQALPETSGATAGKPNLYLDQEGVKTFIATLSEEDAAPEVYDVSSTNWRPIYRGAEATGDGRRLAFVSEEPLTGYDTTDQATGEADLEVYLYEVGSDGPVCISCNPSGARPQGWRGTLPGSFQAQSVAALIPTPQSALDAPRVFSADGRRLFFNSHDALLPRDTNGKADVYVWQEASGAGECQARGADLYVASAGGCLSLISSGQSPSDSLFRDASASGRDVFFTTNASLVTQDPGLVDVYDAREGGGLPPPPVPPGRCQGEACQLAPPPPNDPTPASASFKGPGNAKPAPRCRKGKVARKGRCVARKRKKARKRANRKRTANHNRGTSR